MLISEKIPLLLNLFPNQYFRAVVIFIFLVFLIKIILTILGKIVFSLASKTKTDLDDLIAKKSSVPITIIAFLVSLILTLSEITFSQSLEFIISRIILTLIVLTSGYLVYVIIDLTLLRGWMKFSKKANLNVEESLTNITHTILKIIFIVLALLYILELWGVQIGPFLAGIGIAGLAIALALQPVLANIFSGISIILDKSVRVGDLVNLESGTSGKILKIGLRSTKVKTFDNELVIVPNSKLAESNIHNVALPEPKTRVIINFGVAYGSNIKKVKSVVMKEIKSLKFFINNPEPVIRFLEMADSSLNFKAYFYVNSFENRIDSVDEATTKIYNALNNAKITIPFPQRDVHIKK
jgi:MscS family membrane protein